MTESTENVTKLTITYADMDSVESITDFSTLLMRRSDLIKKAKAVRLTSCSFRYGEGWFVATETFVSYLSTFDEGTVAYLVDSRDMPVKVENPQELKIKAQTVLQAANKKFLDDVASVDEQCAVHK